MGPPATTRLMSKCQDVRCMINGMMHHASTPNVAFIWNEHLNNFRDSIDPSDYLCNRQGGWPWEGGSLTQLLQDGVNSIYP